MKIPLDTRQLKIYEILVFGIEINNLFVHLKKRPFAECIYLLYSFVISRGISCFDKFLPIEHKKAINKEGEKNQENWCNKLIQM